MHSHKENHYVTRIGWLRAAVLGANDGILSTASLMVGIAAANTQREDILLAGIAGLVAGAMSMAAGEYVSVSSQGDAESADIARERSELRANPRGELDELANIYVARGLEPALAHEVARQLTAGDALAAHARDELGISEITLARPVQAAMASAASFAVGASVPLGTALIMPAAWIGTSVSLASLACLAVLGAIGARTGGAPMGKAMLRVTFWGAFAMAITALIGRVSGAMV